MLITDICLKLYLWPYLSYLANIKGFCPQTYRPVAFFPIITLPPGATLSPPISTFQPTPPTNQPTPVTVFPTPTFPTGFPPTQTPLPSTFQPTPPTNQPTPPTNQPTPPTNQPTPPTNQPTPPTNQPTPPTNQPTPPTLTPPTGTPGACPLYPVICLPGGQSPIPNCPCIDPRNRQVGPIGSDMMIFSSLGKRRKRSALKK